MLPSFCRDTVTVMRPAKMVQRGSTVDDWERATPITVSGCSVQPVAGATSYTTDEHERTVRADLFAPSNADIKAGDRIDYGGRSYAIDGAPLPWTSPTGRVSHIRAALIDWEG